MKKFLVITVLALFLALPALAVTDDLNFTADGNITVDGFTLDNATASILIKNGSKAESVEFSNNTLIVTDAFTDTFIIYSADTDIKAIKIASSTISCTTPSYTASDEVTIASSTADNTAFTVSLIAIPNAATYNSSCGAATCNSGYTLSGAGESATCITTPPSGGGGGGSSYQASCTAVVYDEWQTACTNGWQYRNVTSQSPSGCALTTAQENDKKKQCTTTTSCTAVVYDEWQTACTNGWQYRNVKSQSPSGCALTTAQENDKKKQCTAPVTTETPTTPTSAAQQIKNIVAEAATISGRDTAQVLAAVGARQDAKAEANALAKYTTPLVGGLKNVTAEMKTTITNFITYGTPTTKILGAGERAGVINSYKAAFAKVPTTADEWSDVIKIGNGRWPTARNTAAESKATVEFKKVYKRSPDMTKPNDNAAVTVISYGLRPGNRNLNSEKAAIKSFKAIYGHAPVSALAWDIVRAIAYSGAKR